MAYEAMFATAAEVVADGTRTSAQHHRPPWPANSNLPSIPTTSCAASADNVIPATHHRPAQLNTLHPLNEEDAATTTTARLCPPNHPERPVHHASQANQPGNSMSQAIQVSQMRDSNAAFDAVTSIVNIANQSANSSHRLPIRRR
jgi:hypothetical protein